MLKGLDIRDMLIIDRLDLEFQPGLNVLTGETGAGKSILLDSLGFVLGWRGRADLVRKGASQGEVVAEFSLAQDHPAHGVLNEAGLPGGAQLILRRTNNADGRKTAWVNDRRVSGDILRRLSDTLVELHGQHDDRGLLNARGHRQLLDDFGNLSHRVTSVRNHWRSLADARKKLENAETALAEIKQEEDFLRHAVAELDSLDPKAGEDAALDSRRRVMQAAERIGEDIARAVSATGIDGAEGSLTDALRWLEGVAEKADGQLDRPISALSGILNDLGQTQQAIADAQSALVFDANELEAAEDRLFAIRALARKHDVLPDELESHANVLRDRLAALDGGDREVAALRDAVSAAENAYDGESTKLTEARRSAARRLDKDMMLELAPLKMERAEFLTQIELAAPGPDGRDTVAFTVATNPGAPAGQLNKIASGGELSRFLLALKVCLTKGSSGLTMIFDEIDRGVGGATADAVGRRLAALAAESQILVVTHSPQVAARGQHHWRVSKKVVKDVTTSSVNPLDADQRVDEVARMLAGDTVTKEARAAAQSLLSN